MKTPMQEMFDQLKASKKDEYGLAFAIDMLFENEQVMLEKEKELIINAYETGDKYKFEIPGEQYYKENFNTEEK